MGTISSTRRTPECGRCNVAMDRQGSRVTGDGVVRNAYQCPECDKLVFSDVRR